MDKVKIVFKEGFEEWKARFHEDIKKFDVKIIDDVFYYSPTNGYLIITFFIDASGEAQEGLCEYVLYEEGKEPKNLLDEEYQKNTPIQKMLKMGRELEEKEKDAEFILTCKDLDIAKQNALIEKAKLEGVKVKFNQHVVRKNTLLSICITGRSRLVEKFIKEMTQLEGICLENFDFTKVIWNGEVINNTKDSSTWNNVKIGLEDIYHQNKGKDNCKNNYQEKMRVPTWTK